MISSLHIWRSLFRRRYIITADASQYKMLWACQVPEKLNIRIRTNKELLAGHDLWRIDQATADAIPQEAEAG